MSSIGKLMKQAARMQQQMEQIQNALANRTVEATSGGGADEWQRLIRAYAVLHELDKARDALASARKALGQNADIDALAKELGI